MAYAPPPTRPAPSAALAESSGARAPGSPAAVRRRPVARYVVALLATIVLLLAAASVAPAARLAASWGAPDLFDAFHMTTTTGDRKAALVVRLTIAVAALHALWLLVTVRRPAALQRAVAFVVALPLLALPALLVRDASGAAIARQRERFVAEQVAAVDIGAWSDARSAPRRAATTFDDLGRAADSIYRAAGEAALAGADPDPQTRRALFLLGFVSQLWGLGEPAGLGTVACARQNAATGGRAVDDSLMTPRTFLASAVGCCDDYATVLQLLLDRAGIENRLVAAGGHMFNEVRLRGDWRVLDATYGLLLDAPWARINRGDGGIRLVTVPLAGVSRGAGANYRRQLWLARSEVMLNVYAGGHGARRPVGLRPFFAAGARAPAVTSAPSR